ncbi:hypothetical protein H6764_03225 [Candidatus Nomurabacteria bacterium]|nr:hypothetical protein [Candidatus Nomurabacteria bacterium]
MIIPFQDNQFQGTQVWGVLMQTLTIDFGRETSQTIIVNSEETARILTNPVAGQYQYEIPDFYNQISTIPSVGELTPEEAFPFVIYPPNAETSAVFERILTGERSTDDSVKLYNEIRYYINIKQHLISLGNLPPEYLDLGLENFTIAVSVVNQEVYLLIPYSFEERQEIHAIYPVYISPYRAFALGFAKAKRPDGLYEGYKEDSGWFHPLYLIATPQGELKIISLELPLPPPILNP